MTPPSEGGRPALVEPSAVPDGPVTPDTPAGPGTVTRDGTDRGRRPHRIIGDPEHPWADSRFWLLQLVVLALSLIRLAVTVGTHADVTDPAIELTTVVIFLLPVIYGSLTYGLYGGVITGLWVSVLELPRFVGYIDAHSPSGASVELLQIMALLLTAILIGHRVSADHLALRAAEEADLAQRNAEALYRDLFHSNQAPILIVDAAGLVIEVNASARKAFPNAGPVNSERLRPRLVDVIGPVAAGQVLSNLISPTVHSEPTGEERKPARLQPVPFDIEGQLVLLRPAATVLHGSSGEPGLQIVFEDVTEETRRHERMEAYAGQVILGQEEERRHIAQELHDGPVQVLIHLCRQIDSFPAEPGPDGQQATALADLREIVEGTVAELRGIAKGLRPPILDDLGLVASISQLLADSGSRSGITTSIGVTGHDRRLPTAVELAVFRISQEALSNIERHARATRIAVGLDFEGGGGGVRLLVKDDGVGFDAASTDHLQRDSLGLPGMAERAHLAGGTLHIHSRRNEGTTVELSIPNV